MATKKIKIKQTKSLIGCTTKQKACVKGLGLRRINHSVDIVDSPETRGMIKVVKHMVEIS